MKNYPVRTRIFVCLLGMALLLAGCAESELAAVHPQVVRKKIGSPAETLPPPVATAAVASSTLPASEPSPVLSASAEPQESAAPAPKAAVPAPVSSPPAKSQASVSTTATIVEPIRPVAATQPPVPAPEPHGRKLENALSAADSQVVALLNLQVQAAYDPKGKVDPFEALLRDESVTAAGSKLLRKKRDPQSPLEKIDLGQLKLVAIIAAPSGNRALVEESSGKGYILRAGTFVGLNSGKVVDIAIDKVMVEEEFEDAYGKTITQKKEITLPKPPGEL
jgi:type IV pilus assembly protein PilP